MHRSDCAEAQAGLRLCCSRATKAGFLASRPITCFLYQVACNQIVIDFFLSRPTDPVPSRDPPDGAAGDKDNKNITADDDDDNNGDDVLFSR